LQNPRDICIKVGIRDLYIYKVFKNDGSKIRGVVGDVKINGKC